VGKDNYKNVEIEVESTISRRMAWITFPLHARLVKKSREFVNRIKYTDAEILRIAQNRIHLHAYQSNGLFAKIVCWWQGLSGHKVYEDSFRVTGHELKVLLSVARLEDDDTIQVTHEYDVEARYYKELVHLAVARSENG